MTPFFPPIALHGEEDQNDLHQLNPNAYSFPCTIFYNSDDQGASDRNNCHHLHDQQEINDDFLFQAPSHHPLQSYQSSIKGNSTVEGSLCDQYARMEEDPHGSATWMYSKMRIMRKMMSHDKIIEKRRRRNMQAVENQQPNHDSSNNSLTAAIRVCSDCNTTKTPLWRSGPKGPKSLCNACGIRQRKARRALAAVAAMEAGLISSNRINEVQNEESNVGRTMPFKKRCKLINTKPAQKKTCFNDISMSFSKNTPFYPVLQQDVRDAAILLMALSCGLIGS